MYALKRSILRLGLCLTVLSPGPVAAGETLTLEQARQRALADHPGLARIKARYDAALQVPDQLGSLPDPTLKLGILNLPTDTFDPDQEPMTQFQLGIVQPLPWPAKLRHAEAAARYSAEAVGEELDSARLNLQRDVAQVWWSLFYINKAIAVTNSNLERLRELDRIVQSLYRVGKGLMQDALQVQLELSKQQERRIVLVGQQRLLGARLSALLGRTAIDPIQISPPDAGRDGLPLDDVPAADHLIARALANHPEIQRLQMLVRAARAQRAQAEAGLYPDLTLGASYGYRADAPNGADRADLFSISLGIKVPLYAGSKQTRQIRQRTAELGAQQQALYEQQLKLRSDILQAIADYERARQQHRLLRSGMLPQAKQTLAAMLSGYQVGRVNFGDLIRVQLQVNQLEMQYWAAVRDAQQSRETLIAATGGHLYE